MKDLCVWCHQVEEVYMTNGRNASLCEECVGTIQRQAPALNKAKLLPHLELERRVRPMPNPFEKPKMEEFKHGQENS